jgi:hypothetical protein
LEPNQKIDVRQGSLRGNESPSSRNEQKNCQESYEVTKVDKESRPFWKWFGGFEKETKAQRDDNITEGKGNNHEEKHGGTMLLGPCQPIHAYRSNRATTASKLQTGGGSV